MLPSFQAHDSFEGAQQPRVFDWMQDSDINLSENDIFGTEFIPDLDRIFDFTVPLPDYNEDHPSPLDDQESASRRAAAFQRSLWYVAIIRMKIHLSFSNRVPMKGDGYRRRTSMDSAKSRGYHFEMVTISHQHIKRASMPFKSQESYRSKRETKYSNWFCERLGQGFLSWLFPPPTTSTHLSRLEWENGLKQTHGSIFIHFMIRTISNFDRSFSRLWWLRAVPAVVCHRLAKRASFFRRLPVSDWRSWSVNLPPCCLFCV